MPRRRDLSQVRKLSRVPVLSYVQKAADPERPRLEGVQPRKYNTLAALLRFWVWIKAYLKYRIGPRHPFPTYRGEDRGIYTAEGDADGVRIALVGDWATGTDEAFEVSEQVLSFKPHYTIHLGDVYYVGDPDEVRENCLGQKVTAYDPTTWPVGGNGSFAMNGNHEMYARGFGYFDLFLPKLGLRAGGGQRTSFFCLQNDYWRILALDTGYNSIGIPILENIPIWPFWPNCALPDEVMDWLKTDVRPASDDRGLIVLTHHQYYSSFETRYVTPARQLAEVINRPVLWWWGHEHRMATYDRIELKGGIAAYGRCIGHGGMPVELAARPADPLLVFYDNRPYPNDEGIDVGYNGHASLTLRGNTLLVHYVDLKGTTIYSETWQTENGAIRQVAAEPVPV